MIKFNPDRWANVRQTFEKWWEGTLDRAAIKVTLYNDYPYNGTIPLLSQRTCADLTVSPEDIIERIDLHLSNQEYLGDAFPYLCLHSFGPGVLAAMLGAELNTSTGRVWFLYHNDVKISDLHFEYKADNVWLNRIKDICHAGMKKWKGNVMIGMPDLGGPHDVLAVFRGTQNLLMDLYDHSEEVKRCSREILNIWHKVFDEINNVLQPANPGFCDWSGIYSAVPVYIPQCDFSFMISPEQFAQFVFDDLKLQCDRLARSIWHLDGKGMLPHTDQVLNIDSLNAVQYNPGDIEPTSRHWLDLYKKIFDSGKRIMITGPPEDMPVIIQAMGGKGFYYDFHTTDKKHALEFLNECEQKGD